MRILEGIPLRFQIQDIFPFIREGRIQKVFLTETRETWIEFRSPVRTGSIVLSIHPEVCFFYYTQQKPLLKKSKETGWEQILNKYLVGGKIISLEQVGWDRIIRFTIKNQRLWEDQNQFYLFIELTGRNANCILTTATSLPEILGCQRSISSEYNRFRTIAVGQPYHFPPPKPHAIDPIAFLQGEVNLPLPEKGSEWDRWILQHLDGVGRFLSTELAESISFQVDIDSVAINDTIRNRLRELYEPLLYQTARFSVYLSPDDQQPVGFYWLASPQYTHLPRRDFSNLNQAVEYLVRTYWMVHIIQGAKQKKRIFIEKELAFIEEELEKIQASSVPDHELTLLLTKGNLLKMYSQLAIKERKPDGIVVSNLLSPDNQDLFIQLEPRLSVNQNMQLYFRDYRKSQIRNRLLLEKKKDLEFRKERLLIELKNIDRIPFPEAEIIASVEKGFYEPGIMKFLTPSGNTILVGKNDQANHRLVTRFSSRDDFWLHVRDLPGSHVLFRTTQSPDTLIQDLNRAARIAAYFSSARNEATAEVILSPIKNVKVIPRVGFGKVTFRNETTLLVFPSIPDDVRRI